MISFLVFVILGWLQIIAESSILHFAAIYDIIPNLTLILVVSMGILYGSQRGRLLGMILGLIQDILFCRVTGFYALLFYLTGHLCGKMSKDMSKNLVLLPVVLVFGIDIVFGVIQYIVYRFFSGDLQLAASFVRTVLTEACYSSLCTLILYPIFRLLAAGGSLLDESFMRFLKESRREAR